MSHHVRGNYLSNPHPFSSILVHPGLDLPGGDLVLLHDVDDPSPTGGGVAVDGVDQGLRDALEQLVGSHVRLPEGLAHAEELLLGGAADDAVLRGGLAPDEVHVAEVGLAGLGVEPGHDGLDEEGAEAALVEHVGDHGREGLGAHGAALAELVHLDPELDLLEDGLGVGDEAGQADPEVGGDLEDLGEVGGDGAQLDAEARVRGERHAVLALHGDHGAAVVREDALWREKNKLLRKLF